jgi:hypothetical protein
MLPMTSFCFVVGCAGKAGSLLAECFVQRFAFKQKILVPPLVGGSLAQLSYSMVEEKSHKKKYRLTGDRPTMRSPSYRTAPQ